MKVTSKLVVLGTALVLVAAACGGDDDADADDIGDSLTSYGDAISRAELELAEVLRSGLEADQTEPSPAEALAEVQATFDAYQAVLEDLQALDSPEAFVELHDDVTRFLAATQEGAAVFVQAAADDPGLFSRDRADADEGSFAVPLIAFFDSLRRLNTALESAGYLGPLPFPDPQQ